MSYPSQVHSKRRVKPRLSVESMSSVYAELDEFGPTVVMLV